MKPIDLSVVVPCYNEEKNIPLIVARFNKVRSEGISAELILVDNGSTDNSNQLINKFAKIHSFVKLVHVKKNIGYGYGIYSGLKQGRGEFLCWSHADMQTDLKDAFTAYKIVKNKKEPQKYFVKGNRKNRGVIDSFFTFGMSVFETIILQAPMFDINAQPNLFHKSFLKSAGKPPNDFSFDLFYYYQATKNGMKIIRFPVVFASRIHGVSHWNTSLRAKWKFIKRTIDFTFKLKRRL